MKNYGIILASGIGSRYNSDIPKQFVEIAGKTILEHTIEIFEKSPEIDEIIVVITPEYRQVGENLILKNNYKKISKLLNGGETRKDSSSIAIQSICDEEANVIIHDCARPFLSQRIIKDCINALQNHKAVGVAIPSSDTIIEVKENVIESIPERKNLRRIQTPQCFKLSTIRKAHELSKDDNNFTDDCGLIVKYNLCDVFIVDGEETNIKITYPEDIYMADRLFQLRNAENPLISVIVASYNYENYIKETLDSLVNQTYKNFEVIIVDDGSKDDSVNIIKEYTEKYENFKLYTHDNHENKGLTQTIQLALSKVKGEYIAFLESDDYYHEDYLQEKVKFLNEFKTDIVVNNIELIGYPDKKKITYVKTCFKYMRKTNFSNMFLDNALSCHIPTFSCILIKTDILRRCDFNTYYDAWLDFWLYRQILFDNNVGFLDKKLTYWRIHQASYIKQTDKSDGEKKKRLIKKEFIKKSNSILIKKDYFRFIKFQTILIAKTLVKNIFSITNDSSNYDKIITIMGLSIRIHRER